MADLDLPHSSPWRLPRLVAGYSLLWLLLLAPLAILWVGAELRQAEAEFRSQAGAIYGEVGARLQANEAALVGLAVFSKLSSAQGPDSGLEQYSAELLGRFPHIYQVLLQQRVAAADVPVMVERMRGSGRPGSGGLLRDYRPVAGGPEYYYPVTFIAPDHAQSRALRGVDVHSLPQLRDALERALEQARPAASQPFVLRDGETAYALVHPVHEVEEAAYGSVAVSVLVRARDLLPTDNPFPEGLRVTLRGPQNGERELLLVISPRWSPAGVVERWVFPRLSYVAAFQYGSQPFELVAEQQLGWESVPPTLLAAGALAVLLGLVGATGLARLRLSREYERLRSEQRLYRLANFDALTGLPNRNLLRDRLQHAVSRARRYRGSVAVLFLDLDGFKAVNDTAGHASGDKLLIEVAQRLQSCVRDQDTVGRLSGDEFVIVLEDISSRGDAERVEQEVQDCLLRPITIGEFQFLVSASIGVALYPEDGTGEEELLRKADHAMYRVKHPEWVAPPG